MNNFQLNVRQTKLDDYAGKCINYLVSLFAFFGYTYPIEHHGEELCRLKIVGRCIRIGG